jgi:hypothetical protein
MVVELSTIDPTATREALTRAEQQWDNFGLLRHRPTLPPPTTTARPQHVRHVILRGSRAARSRVDHPVVFEGSWSSSVASAKVRMRR